MALRLVTGPATEPVSLDEAKAQCRVEVTDDDAYITALIVAAREATEHLTNRVFITQTWRKTLDDFDEDIRLDNPPIISVDSVEYRDSTGAWQTLSASAYLLDDQEEPGWIVAAYGYDWPEVYDDINAVKITYQAGYGSANAVPVAIKQYILLMVGHYYANRAASGEKLEPLPFLEHLIDRYKIYAR